MSEILMDYTVSDINKALTELPALVLTQEKNCEDKRLEWSEEEAVYDAERARSFQRQKAKGLGVEEAKCAAEDETSPRRIEVLLKESTYRKAVSELHYLENRFTAIRKIANLKEMETRYSERV